MDQIFDSQFLAMQAAFARDGIAVEIAYAPNGQASYIYQTGRLLVDVGRYPDIITQIRRLLPGTVPDQREQPISPDLRVLSIEQLDNGQLSVPDALNLLDADLGEYFRQGGKGDAGEERPRTPGDYSPVTPVHVLHLAQNSSSSSGRICPATEPEVPYCCCPADRHSPPDPPGGPCPPQAAGNAGAGVLIGVCDTGLLASSVGFPWLANVTGVDDPLGPLLAGVPPIPPGLHAIPQYTGHGTFVAGVASCQAPGAGIYVYGDIVTGGGVLETTIVNRLTALLATTAGLNVVNLSAGGYTRHDFLPLSFTVLDLGGVTLIAAAGNDATHRKFWPAAFPWAVGVGALGADQRNRAWFSNYGDWVNVYAPGEGLVNAYATGVYAYQEPPKRPAQQIFDGMARWSGTSFAAPLVAGLIAAQMSSASASAADATATVLAQAAEQAIPGVGPALFPRD
jgi:Subtilase family